ncbi:MAG TPA: DUF1844 domain-containing protein [Pirellulales bacterium]
MDEASGETPKLHIDEDWKSQAQAEKERLEQAKAAGQKSQPADAQAAHESQPAPPAEPAAGRSPPAQRQPAEHAHQLPPATLAVLITTLATQVMVLLGQIANPISGKAEIDLPQAQHFIDTLAMLEAKTAGNRTPEETRLLDNLLHELRMAYVQVSREE